jgi:hypothetical protein
MLKSLKKRIDEFASSNEGFDDLLAKALRHKSAKAERIEKARDTNGIRPAMDNRNYGASARNAFKFTHRAVESLDRTTEAARAKNCAYSSMLLSQLCQMAAALSLQHRTLIEFSGNGFK